VALHIADDVLAAEASIHWVAWTLPPGSLEEAHETFLQALELGGASQALRARVEQIWESSQTFRDN